MNFKALQGKLTTSEVKQMNPLVLAFIGDAVYEVFIRSYLVSDNKPRPVHRLHKEAVSYVKAHAQSEYIKKIESILSEEEHWIFKRGRNAKSGTVPKNANVQEYRMATGFEAVIGFLYLTEQNNRLDEILDEIIKLEIE